MGLKASRVLVISLILSFGVKDLSGLPRNRSSYPLSHLGHDSQEIKSSVLDHSVKSKELPNKCEAGRVYRVRSVEELVSYESESECLFRAAVEPSKVPEGPMYGKVLDLFSYHTFNFIVPFLWTGKFIEKVNCSGKELFLGWNKFLTQPHFPFISSIDKIYNAVNLHPLEVRDEKVGVMIDYTKEVLDFCPNLESVVKASSESMIIQKSCRNRNMYPVNQFVDVIRLVGRQADGGAIYLGKMYGKDKFTSGHPAKSHAFFYLVNYDMAVNPEFKSGDPLTPLEEDLYYRLTGIADIVTMVLPHDNVFSEPIQVSKQMVNEIIPSSRGITNILIDAISGGEDLSRFDQIFKESIPSNSTFDLFAKNYNGSYFLSDNSIDHSHFNEL